MKQVKLVVGGALALLLAACNSTGSGSTTSANYILNEEGEITHICRNETKVGTNFKERVCRTVAEMEEMGEKARQDVERAQRSHMDSRNF
ncbi:MULTISPECIES: hypothetical protein [Pseudidiomarina]|uniref:Lipoprotein n=2 Tax=Pseudidiomarina TaxID=2800384 RepID=A0A0K6HBX4_9GAMM|nr:MULTISPECIES: hypothetical protein [Pseudidiomarina]RUO49014.1 hypothetical protein CWE24_00415 [Pseudidiomarina donghaiensis]CUA88261.1 hypothetical protein Ga0061064_2124 [Pseudidiomarina woesei]SFV20455.1 hypothetical protein SAMN04488139_0216 [Pseudidiomarina donghaiensis]